MAGQVLVTVGLALDIVGVALLLAGPRVHPRIRGLLTLDGGPDEVSSLRRVWSKLGAFGLPIVTVGFTLQIIGTWADEIDPGWLVGIIVTATPLVFIAAYVIVRQLPSGD